MDVVAIHLPIPKIPQGLWCGIARCDDLMEGVIVRYRISVHSGMLVP